LCAGFGKRLKPYTQKYQKTMIPVHGKPLLEYIINGIITTGIRDFILVVGYLKEQIIDYFQDGANLGIRVEYVEQKELDGTGGALLLCENYVKNDHFFLSWGDILVSYRVYRAVCEIYRVEKEDFVLVTNYVDDPYKGGAIYCEENYCLDVVEKPSKGKSKSNLNNCGIFIFSKDIFEVLKQVKLSERGEIELTDAIRIGIKEKNWKVRAFKMDKDEFRADFGDVEGYERFKKDASWLKKLD
jgi:dTDP-glucose pyrophosphorylase